MQVHIIDGSPRRLTQRSELLDEGEAEIEKGEMEKEGLQSLEGEFGEGGDGPCFDWWYDWGWTTFFLYPTYAAKSDA